MGNRALRKQVGELMRKHGGFNSRLYRGKVGRNAFSAQDLRDIIARITAALSGAIVHDCDGGNHKVAALSPWPLNRKIDQHDLKGGYVYRFPDQFLFADGRYGCGCSLGVDAPISREEIERYWLSWPESELSSGKFLKDGAIEHLRAGGHLHDENGILLTEWKRGDNA